MTSRDQKKSVLHEKLQLLRSVTNSSALSKASIIVDASKYIQELKQKVEACKRDLAEESSLPMVTVETLEKGFWINVFSDKNCPGMLISVLQAFQELGLDVLDATVSSADSFRLEAVGGEQPQNESVDAQMVRQVVVQAIKKCMGS
ncbi:transcription factor SCREAM2-like isoform X1 [Musa acuminata AAA Group]|uniref:transcription factor SCREAM2-like isoform X1 n=1 Tax=Musa acuminata AAA Group TaxID=214697 RepID=UPI0031E3EB7B